MRNKFIIGAVVIILCFTLIFLIGNKELNNKITGKAIGTAQVNVLQVAQITLTADNVNFGNISAGSTDNTTDDNPVPFEIRNDGSVEVNVTIARQSNSTALFNGTGGGDDTASFQFKAGVAGEGISANPACSVADWTHVPGTDPLVVLCEFNYQDSNDEAEIELLINPPADEPAGTKSENLVFTAYQS